MINEPGFVSDQVGWIEVICGGMFSGKTEELIRRAKRAHIAGQRVVVVKPAIDNRYSDTEVVSHNENALPGIQVDTADQIILLTSTAKVVCIDEAQFFDDGIVAVANQLADLGLRVIVTGLDTDFRGEPFGCMPVMTAKADKVDKLAAICMVCGEAATRTQRLVNGKPANYNDPIVIVGASEMYEARCRRHHEVPRD